MVTTISRPQPPYDYPEAVIRNLNSLSDVSEPKLDKIMIHPEQREDQIRYGVEVRVDNAFGSLETGSVSVKLSCDTQRLPKQTLRRSGKYGHLHRFLATIETDAPISTQDLSIEVDYSLNTTSGIPLAGREKIGLFGHVRSRRIRVKSDSKNSVAPGDIRVKPDSKNSVTPLTKEIARRITNERSASRSRSAIAGPQTLAMKSIRKQISRPKEKLEGYERIEIDLPEIKRNENGEPLICYSDDAHNLFAVDVNNVLHIVESFSFVEIGQIALPNCTILAPTKQAVIVGDNEQLRVLEKFRGTFQFRRGVRVPNIRLLATNTSTQFGIAIGGDSEQSLFLIHFYSGRIIHEVCGSDRDKRHQDLLGLATPLFGTSTRQVLLKGDSDVWLTDGDSVRLVKLDSGTYDLAFDSALQLPAKQIDLHLSPGREFLAFGLKGDVNRHLVAPYKSIRADAIQPTTFFANSPEFHHDWSGSSSFCLLGAKTLRIFGVSKKLDPQKMEAHKLREYEHGAETPRSILPVPRSWPTELVVVGKSKLVHLRGFANAR